MPPPCTSVSELLLTSELESVPYPGVGSTTSRGSATTVRPDSSVPCGMVSVIVSGRVIS